MAIGLSSYAFFWRSSAAAPEPLGLHEMLAETASLGVSVFQICDYPAIESMTPAQLRAVRDDAAGRGITLELGTRGIGPDHPAAAGRTTWRSTASWPPPSASASCAACCAPPITSPRSPRR
jgi:hypothetical protein